MSRVTGGHMQVMGDIILYFYWCV